MKRQQSSSIVFLTELFLALTIFALCSSVCAGLFGWSHQFSKQSYALSEAVIAAQSGAEAFKRNVAPEALAKVLGGDHDATGCMVYYDDNWAPTGKNDASYMMRIGLTQDAILRYAKIVVSNRDETEIFTLDTSALVTEVGR